MKSQRKKRGQFGRGKARPRESRWHGVGTVLAGEGGVYIVESGDINNPKWLVYGLKTGRYVLTYYPKCGSWSDWKGSHGTEPNFRAVFQRAADLDVTPKRD
jgi:hypothetical protein